MDEARFTAGLDGEDSLRHPDGPKPSLGLGREDDGLLARTKAWCTFNAHSDPVHDATWDKETQLAAARDVRDRPLDGEIDLCDDPPSVVA